MNIRYSTLILGAAAEIILAVVFFSLIPSDILTGDIRWLDFIVMSVINIIFILNVLFPFVNLDDKSHKEVAGLGIQWTATGWYAALAFLFLIGNIIYSWQSMSHPLSFGIQATIQSAILLFYIGGIVASRASMNKSQEVYSEQSAEKKGKANIKAAVTSLLATTEETPLIPADITGRIRDIAADTRYISPSSTSEASEADKAIIRDCDIIEVALRDYEMNRDMISRQLSRLEQDMKRRRNLRN
ncbi:MAG: hypothetical protein K2K75_13655 [Muribaculaceae bacterium]|nr:hypothetical protein [Muribaculaceae bacterium]